jgi:t-SNARE complex subunit (syntaxin)
MAKINSTANDAQLKARRTNLEKKNHDELINIILRKDSTERKNNAKIQELQALLKEADSLNEEKATRISGFEKDMNGMEDLVRSKQEQIDNLIDKNNTLAEQVEEWSKKYVNCKSISSLRRKIMFTCFGIIAILIVLLFVI